MKELEELNSEEEKSVSPMKEVQSVEPLAELKNEAMKQIEISAKHDEKKEEDEKMVLNS